MPDLRAVTVAMPPLLADIIRHALASRTGIELIEIAASPGLIERLQALDPDLVLISETNSEAVRRSATVAAVLKRAKVVTLSRDGHFILDAGKKRALTADGLADLLR